LQAKLISQSNVISSRRRLSIFFTLVRFFSLFINSLTFLLSSLFDAVIRQTIEVKVHDEYAVPGSTAVFKCQLPAISKHLLRIVGWQEEPSGRQFSSSDVPSVNRSIVVLPTGELYLHSVGPALSRRRFRCKLQNLLTGELFTSATTGKLYLPGKQPSNHLRPTRQTSRIACDRS
jgi:hypothetical protein